MVTIDRTIRIQAPVTRVFEYVTDPEHLPEIWPSMIEVTNVSREASGRHSFDWTYKMAGLRFHGHADTLELEPLQRVVTHNETGIPSTFRWEYKDLDGETELHLQIDYEVPGKLLEKLAEPFVRRINEREAETLLNNLKSRMEMGRARSTKVTELRA